MGKLIGHSLEKHWDHQLQVNFILYQHNFLQVDSYKLAVILRSVGNANLEGLDDLVVAFANHSSDQVRPGVAKALRHSTGPAAREVLKQLSKDSSYVVRECKFYLSVPP